MKKNSKSAFFSPSVSKNELQKTGRFVLLFAALYIIFSGLFYLAVPIKAVEGYVAGVTLFFLNLFGQQGTVSFGETAMIQLSNGVNIAISDLCTGIMELFIILSVIIASQGISWKKRLIGAVASVIVLQFFNFARILITIAIILGNNPTEVIDFAHNILFRVFLFIVIAGTYIVWFYYSVKK